MSETQELPAGVGAVFPFSEERAWRARLKIISATAGIKPVAKRNDDEVQRATYAPAKSRTILNWSSAKILERLGYPQAAMTIEVEDTRVAAELALRILGEYGYVAEYIDAMDIELGIPSGFMHFVVTPGQVPMLFWPKKPDPVLLAQMSPPEPWTDDL